MSVTYSLLPPSISSPSDLSLDCLSASISLESRLFPSLCTGSLSHHNITLPSNDLIVARIDGSVVGYLFLSSRSGSLSITSLGVDPTLHRQGLGSRLLRLAVVYFRGLKKGDKRRCVRSSLNVGSDNDKARAMYLKMGFIEEGRVEGYYKDGGDAVRMVIEDLGEVFKGDRVVVERGEGRGGLDTLVFLP